MVLNWWHWGIAPPSDEGRILVLHGIPGGAALPPLTGTIPAGIQPTLPESAVEFEVQGCSCPVLPNPPW